MLRLFANPVRLLILLFFCTFIPILMAGTRAIQIPSNGLPEDSLRLGAVPVSFFFHAVGGLLFGLLGPIQFARVLWRRHGRLHRILGRVFVLAGLCLGLSSLSMLMQVESPSTALIDIYRGVAGAALLVTLAFGLWAALRGQIAEHRAWMIRAYAIGMGSGTVALVMFPIYLYTGKPIEGLFSDVVFTGWWTLNILLAEWVIHRSAQPEHQIRIA